MQRGIAILAVVTLSGCTTTLIRQESTPVEIAALRPEPPPPPAPKRVEVEKTRIRVDEKIHFEFDRAEIKPESFDLLAEIAQVINANPQLKKIRIEGHTDNVGTDKYNLDLSKRRAQAVLKHLTEQGNVEAARLISEGYGLSRPLASNESDEGRAQNRRVEFNIIEQDEVQQ